MTSDRKPLSRRTVLLGAAATAGLAATRARLARGEETRPAPQAMPTCFVGHGSPMLALDEAKGRELTRMGAALPAMKAILVVSAHYERSPVTLGATTTRPLIYDFRGFPRALYQVRYAPPGAPGLARRVTALLSPLGPVQSDPRRGLDHGAWVPLRWMAPKADVPVLPVSLPTHDPQTLWRLARALAPLRDEGVLILGSGNMTHNLRRIDGRAGAPTPAWASEFDDWARTTLSARSFDALLDWERKAPAARTNHPTVEHFVPLLVAAGASRRSDAVSFPITGFDAGSLSRRCVVFGDDGVR